MPRGAAGSRCARVEHAAFFKRTTVAREVRDASSASMLKRVRVTYYEDGDVETLLAVMASTFTFPFALATLE